MRKLDLNTPVASEPRETDSTTPSVATPSDMNSSVGAQSPAPTPLDEKALKTDNQPVIKKPGSDMKNSLKKILPILVLAVIAGVGTGFGLNKITAEDTGVPADGKIQKVAGPEINNGDVFGSTDEKTFKDTAIGYLEKGGIDGEGSHKLLRPGGETQTVYLTSSITDLDKLVGMEIQIWGETFRGQKAGWLMDVGRVKIIATEGESPAEE